MNQEISEQKTTVEPNAVSTGPARVPQIPDHTLLRRIGGGSYGEVWLARNVMGTYRAVKIVYRQTFSSERPYEREFTGIKKFDPISRSHDGLVDVLHVGRNDHAGYFYYVMELADDAHKSPKCKVQSPRSDLEARAADFANSTTPSLQHSTPNTYVPKTLSKELHMRGRLPVEECLQLSLSLTAALGHLHKNGLIHRDIKPSNIIFVNGVPKLADIGLVVGTGEARSFVGTEGYIPKEDPPGTVQADLYSLGKVIYEICTGKDRQDYPELPTQMGDGNDRTDLLGLNEVIVKACESDVRKRYQSADEMHADLLRLQSGQPVKRPRAGLATIFGTPIKARQWAAVLGIALLALAVTLALTQNRPKKADENKLGSSVTDGKPALAQALPPIVAALPAGEVLAIAYAGKPPAPAASTATPQLQFDILACRAGERKFQPLEDGARLRSEVDGYLLVARPLTAGYLYVFQVDASGKKEWLFPRNDSSTNSSGANPVTSGELIQIPPQEKNSVLFLDRTIGVEHIYVVFSATKWPDLEHALPTPPPVNRSASGLLAQKVEVPIGLGLRGVGGTRTNTTPFDVQQALSRIEHGKSFTLTLSGQSIDASGFYLAIERWFRHTE